MNRVYFGRICSGYGPRLLICAAGMAAWGLILPVIYSTFGKTLADILRSNPFLSQFSQFGGGDLFTLSGAMAIGFIHPFSVALLAVFAIGFPIAQIAGERQRGTLEVLLARPISRRSLYLTAMVAGALFVGILLAIELAANVVSASVVGVLSEIDVANVPVLWLNGWLLFLVFMAVAFAASVSFDRIGPPAGIALAALLVTYLVNVIASLWPDARWIDDFSLFHYVKAKLVLEGNLAAGDLVVLGLIFGAMAILTLVVFPRRDIAAPS